MLFKIKEFKRDKFIVVDERGIPVLEDPENSFKSLVFEDIDDALELRDKLNNRLDNLE